MKKKYTGRFVLFSCLLFILGFITVFLKEQINNNRRKSKAIGPRVKGGGLDFVETAHREKIYPLIFCRMAYEGRLDVSRLANAVALSAKVVPEILYGYDFKRNCFVNMGLGAEDAVLTNVGAFDEGWRWDLSKTTQLKVLVQDKSLVIGMSHMLSDGAGFLQYLYLLASLYNGEKPENTVVNSRDITPVLKGVKVGRATQQERRGRKKPALSLGTDHKMEGYFCLSTPINSAALSVIQAKAKKLDATLNDVFLTAYARVLTRLFKTDAVVLPCPADLRQFAPRDAMTIANCTGMYKVAIEVQPGHSFDATLAQVHIEMLLQKKKRRCFAGMGRLQFMHRKLPVWAVNWIVKKNYGILPLSYTNMGKIDHSRLALQGAEVTGCFLTGAYRLPPEFQLCISTYQNICTLSCGLMGSENRKQQAGQILRMVKQELLLWAEDKG